MSQITVRAPDELIARVKDAAEHSGRSMNEYVTLVLDVATDPAKAASGAEELRERLRRAGLLLTVPETTEAPSITEIEGAGRRMATGRPLADIVGDER